MSEQIISQVVRIEEIDSIAKSIISIADNKDIFILEGNLGYGKTTLIRSIAKNLETTSIVSSPTFTIINEYDIILAQRKSTLRHVDLYRLESEDEAHNVGLLEIMYEDGITFVEWGTKFIDLFERYYLIDINYIDENVRNYKITRCNWLDIVSV